MAVASQVDLVDYGIRLGDDALILAQRLSEWSTRAPDLEEDIALSNIALDLLGQARYLLSLAGERDEKGRTEDDFAFLRSEREFHNLQIVEQPNGDFANTIVRQLLFSAYQVPLYTELSQSTDEGLRSIAVKALKEVAYHRDHAVKWTLRLGDGTAESHRRMVAALAHLYPYTPEMFETDDLTERLCSSGVAAHPATIQTSWESFVTETLNQATLPIPGLGPRRPLGGRRGVHSEGFGHLLAEMQWLHRSYPGAEW
jgi:ring-1,2-phenylacetyl-CoA epoxidase subunit PaaC